MFTLTAGASYTRDDKDITALNATAGVTPPAVTLDKSFEAFTPQLAVEFSPSDDTLAYASVTKGFKSGDVNIFANLVAGEDARVKHESIRPGGLRGGPEGVCTCKARWRAAQ